MTRIEDIDWSEVEEFYGWMVRLCCLLDGSIVGGCRTLDHNEAVGGTPGSKHTFNGGWGMAADIWFDSPNVRDRAIELTRKHKPNYHCYTGSTQNPYAPNRLHVQGWKVGELPSWRINR